MWNDPIGVGTGLQYCNLQLVQCSDWFLISDRDRVRIQEGHAKPPQPTPYKIIKPLNASILNHVKKWIKRLSVDAIHLLRNC